MFLKYDEIGTEFTKFRNSFMNEYYQDMTKRINQIDEVTRNVN